MLDLFDEPIEIQDLPNASDINIRHGHVVFDNVHFTYDSGVKAIRGISFEVPPGKTVALVGPSGSGKSTIVRLLFRFYDVQEGAVCIDGRNIKHVRCKSLRQAIGVVPQDTVLFNDTIRYNIRYGKLHATDEEVEAAAAKAEIHHRIMTFPDGTFCCVEKLV